MNEQNQKISRNIFPFDPNFCITFDKSRLKLNSEKE